LEKQESAYTREIQDLKVKYEEEKKIREQMSTDMQQNISTAIEANETKKSLMEKLKEREIELNFLKNDLMSKMVPSTHLASPNSVSKLAPKSSHDESIHNVMPST